MFSSYGYAVGFVPCGDALLTYFPNTSGHPPIGYQGVCRETISHLVVRQHGWAERVSWALAL